MLHLREHYWKWLHLEEQAWVHVADSAVVEQFVRILPAKGGIWLLQHLHGTLSDAMWLMENFVDAEWSLETEFPRTLMMHGMNHREA